jgi:putative integral membrane protein (TIGR02587 family)
LVALSFYAGFEKAFSLVDNILDVFAAIAVSAMACLLVLVVFGQTGTDDSAGTTSKLALLCLAASIGALLANKQFNDAGAEDKKQEREHRRSLFWRLFLSGVGAIFLALNIAPTDEVELIAAAMTPLQAGLLACLSVAALHLILIAVDKEEGASVPGRFVRRTLLNYGVCLLLCWYILWSISRLDGVGLADSVERVIVLAFPASLGAGAARLILGPRPDE